MFPVDLTKATVDRIEFPLLKEKHIELFMLRLDKIHPVISGNKWFKLKYHLECFKKNNYKGILTFGGAYSNHIIATAYVAKLQGIKSTGIIRGEKPRELSPTLKECIDYGMQLEFVPRDIYRQKINHNSIPTEQQFPGYYTIPEGGAGAMGEKGCREILDRVNKDAYSHIACAIGTGTMFLGLANSSFPEVIGICVLKGMKDLPGQFNEMIHPPAKKKYCKIFYDYHAGGYARHTPELFSFMNDFYLQTGIPTDFVYNGKLVFAITDLAEQGYFPQGSSLLLIHSGGLQGNASLRKGTLIF